MPFIFRFQTAFTFNQSVTARLSPKYRHLGLTEGFLPALPQTYIYQLGLLPWLLAANKHTVTAPAWCKIVGCTLGTGTTCAEPHSDLIQLPTPSEETPEYLKQIIAACRADDPAQRPPAHELLKMFSDKLEGEAGKESSREHGEEPLEGGKCLDDKGSRAKTQKDLTRPEECQKIVAPRVDCDKCGNRTVEYYFHCSTCVTDNFDLCPRCVSQGIHCFNDAHLLQKVSERNPVRSYFISVKETGARDIVYL
jgi:hypothetical protein